MARIARMARTLLLTIVTIGSVSVTSALAQVKYTDGQGVTHWVQSEAQVPAAYRAAATRPALPGLGNGDARQRAAYQRTLAAETRRRERERVKAERRARIDAIERRELARQFLGEALEASDRVHRRGLP